MNHALTTTESCGDAPVTGAELAPSVAADVVLFGRARDRYRVLTIERRDPPHQHRWALPGGMLEADESLPQAAVRELAEETGVALDVADLTEVGSYSAPGRDPRGRVVSVAFAAVLADCPTPQAGDDARQARWALLDAVTDDPAMLAFDHRQIVTDAAALLSDELAAGLPGQSPVVDGINAATDAFVTALDTIDPAAYGAELGELRRSELYALVSGLDVVRGLVAELLAGPALTVIEFGAETADLDSAISALEHAGEQLADALDDLAS